MPSPILGIAELRAPSAPALRTRRLRVSRRRLASLISGLLAIVAAGVAAIAFAGGPGGAPPAEGAAALVPGDALSYVHLSTDASRPAVKRALALLTKLPGFGAFSGNLVSRLAAVAGGSTSTSYSAQIHPWLGKEAALAFLNTPSSTAGSLLVLDVADQRQAYAFVTRSGASAAARYRSSEIFRYPAGTELAFVEHYLVVGADASVRASIDVARGAAGSLAESAAYRRATGGAAADRVLEGFASAGGVRRLLAAQGGPLAGLASLLFSPSLAGVGVSLSASTGGVHIRLHSVLDPMLTRVSGRTSTSFAPTLTSLIPAGSPFLLDLPGLDKTAPRLFGAASAAGIAGRIAPLLQRLGAALHALGVNVPALLSIFHGETAIAVAPAMSPSRPPSLLIVTRTANQAKTSAELAGLQVPLAQLFPAPAAGPGRTPMFNDRHVAGITAHQLALTPGLELDYAVWGGLVVISSSLDGIAAVANHQHALAGEREFQSALAGRPNRVGSLLFLDFSQLLSLGEQTGITHSASLTALQPDLQRIRAVGLSSTSGEDDSTAELSLLIP